MSSGPDYPTLSRRYAESGDLRMAQLAAWAADVHALEALLWENGLDQAPDPAAQLALIGASVAAALDEAADSLDGSAATVPTTARDLVGLAREAMVTTFDESVHGLLSDRLADLEHLDHASAAVERPTSDTADRLAGRGPEELAAELGTAAADCAAMADLLRADGDAEAAGRLDRQADAAAYEAYLVRAAMRSGDVSFATVDLRWDLLADMTGPRRERFAEVVGAAERGALEESLRVT